MRFGNRAYVDWFSKKDEIILRQLSKILPDNASDELVLYFQVELISTISGLQLYSLRKALETLRVLIMELDMRPTFYVFSYVLMKLTSSMENFTKKLYLFFSNVIYY